MFVLIGKANKEDNKEHRRVEMNETKFYQHIDALSKEISKVFSEMEMLDRLDRLSRLYSPERLANKKPWYRRLFK